MEIRQAFLGHTFTYDRPKFWTLLGDVAQDVRRGFVTLGIKYPPLSTPQRVSPHDFEGMYFHDPRLAFEWQEHYNDDGEIETDLLSLLHLLRQAVSMDAT